MKTMITITLAVALLTPNAAAQIPVLPLESGDALSGAHVRPSENRPRRSGA